MEGVGGEGWGRHRKLGKCTASAKMRNKKKPRQYTLAKMSTREKMKKKMQGILQWRN